MSKNRHAPMPTELEAEAKNLFDKWLDTQGEIVTGDPFDYIYAHASDSLKRYCDKQNPICDTIFELRKRTGLSQTEFGKQLDIPMRSIQNWENGVSKCPGYVVKLISYWVEHEYPEK